MEHKKHPYPLFEKRMDKLRGDDDNTTFAKRLGLSRQTVGFYLNGDRGPDIGNLISISKATGRSIDWLMGLLPEEMPSNDETIRIIQDYTGLSTNAIKALNYYREFHKSKNNSLETENSLTIENINRVLGEAYERISEKRDNDDFPELTLYSVIESYILGNEENVRQVIPEDIFEKAMQYDLEKAGSIDDKIKITKQYEKRKDDARKNIVFDNNMGGKKKISLLDSYRTNTLDDIMSLLKRFRVLEESKQR